MSNPRRTLVGLPTAQQIFSIGGRYDEMEHSWWLSIGMGIGIIGVHAVVRVLAHYFAFSASDQRQFLLLELGGLGGRMVLVFGAVALVGFFLPVRIAVFVSTVIVLLILSVIVETFLVARRMDRGTLGF